MYAGYGTQLQIEILKAHAAGQLEHRQERFARKQPEQWAQGECSEAGMTITRGRRIVECNSLWTQGGYE